MAFKSRWPKDCQATLRELWPHPDWTARAIAEEIGRRHGLEVTRNAVIGTANRMGLATPLSPEKVAKRAARAAMKAAEEERKMIEAEGGQARLLQAAVTADRLTAQTCRYPLWPDDPPLPKDAADRPYCGRKVDKELDESFCPEHYAKCRTGLPNWTPKNDNTRAA